MSGNNCDKKNKKSNLGGGVPGLVGNGGHGGRSRGAGSSQDRFRLRNGFGQYQFLANAGIVKPEEVCADRKTVLTPFRQAFNAGDYLGTINSGPNSKLPQINLTYEFVNVIS